MTMPNSRITTLFLNNVRDIRKNQLLVNSFIIVEKSDFMVIVSHE